MQRFRFLESDSAGRDHRHRNLRSLLAWSYGLSSAERHDRRDAGTDHPQALGILGSLLLYAKCHGNYMTMFRWCRMVLDPVSGAESVARPERCWRLAFMTVVYLATPVAGHEFDQSTELVSITGTFTATRVRLQ